MWQFHNQESFFKIIALLRYNYVGFSTFTELCKISAQFILEHFLQEETLYPAVTSHFPPVCPTPHNQPQVTVSLFSVSVDWSILDISYTLTCTVCSPFLSGLFHLACFQGSFVLQHVTVLFFPVQIVFCCVNVPHFVYAFIP